MPASAVRQLCSAWNMPTKTCAPQEGPGDDSVESNAGSTAVPSWALLLDEATNTYTTRAPLSLEHTNPHLQRFSEQIDLYGHALHVTYSAEDKREIPDSPALLTKELILETRAALRFAMLCLSREVTRSQTQREAIVTHRWHRSLCYVLSLKTGDSNCRLVAARLLSNLVTSNSETAGVVASDLPLSPCRETIELRIRTAFSEFTNEKTTEHVCKDPTWVDMILACAQSSCREGLAAIATALHNCISSIHSKQPDPDYSFAKRLASDDLLISTLLRQMIPANSITALGNSDENGHFDSATEWIVLTIEKLCSLGLLPEMYSSAGGKSCETALKTVCVTPEQVVLFHCAARAVEEATQPSTNIQQQLCLGGEGERDAVVSSNVFLARTLSSLRGVLSNVTAPQLTNGSDLIEDKDLTKSAWFLILEMLASSLGVDEPAINQTRLFLGRETSLIQDVALDLGAVFDSLSAKNHGRRAHELCMSEDEQRSIVGLVRLLGNLCFRCRQNQDMVRQTIVPLSFLPTDAFEPSSTMNQRTALHVLLSCTSFSYGCFTLREWAIVALRNALECNKANQDLVEKLEAQQPLQNAELEKMNVKVDMNQQGQVRIVPLETQTHKSKKEDDTQKSRV